MHLMYGIEFDSTLNWLIGNSIISSLEVGQTKTMEIADIQTNSSSWGNYNNSTGDAATNCGGDAPQNTGASEYWKANNIYDLAGNGMEWTQEKYSTETYGAYRGGTYFTEGKFSVAVRARAYEETAGVDTRLPCQLFCNTEFW